MKSSINKYLDIRAHCINVFYHQSWMLMFENCFYFMF